MTYANTACSWKSREGAMGATQGTRLSQGSVEVQGSTLSPVLVAYKHNRLLPNNTLDGKLIFGWVPHSS